MQRQNIGANKPLLTFLLTYSWHNRLLESRDVRGRDVQRRWTVSFKPRQRAVSLFLENRGEERKTNERASVTSTVSVMCKRRCREPLILWASFSDARATCALRHRRSYVRHATIARLRRLHGYLFCVPPHGFSRKRETARSLLQAQPLHVDDRGAAFGVDPKS